MEKVKIDISISFNDISIKGLSLGLVGKPISYYDQLIVLLKSIHLNWEKTVLDYSIYVYHSRPLDEKKKKELETLGATLMFIPEEYGNFLNRPCIYKSKTSGTHSLILDTDILVLKTPAFNFDKEIYFHPESHVDASGTEHYNSMLKPKIWEELYSKLKYDTLDKYKHINNGCILIKNESKHKVYSLLFSKTFQEINQSLLKINPHFAGQIIYSLIFKSLNYGYFTNSINAFSLDLNDFTNIEILHYLGSKGYTEKVKKEISKITKLYGKWSLQNN